MRNPYEGFNWQDPQVKRGVLTIGALFTTCFSLLLSFYCAWGLVHNYRLLHGDDIAESVIYEHPLVAFYAQLWFQ